MAAFENVMKNWARMCKEHSVCDSCPLCDLDICPDDIVYYEYADFSEIEKRVNGWAKDHQIDNKPTIGAWLIAHRMSIFDPVPDALLNSETGKHDSDT